MNVKEMERKKNGIIGISADFFFILFYYYLPKCRNAEMHEKSILFAIVVAGFFFIAVRHCVQWYYFNVCFRSNEWIYWRNVECFLQFHIISHCTMGFCYVGFQKSTRYWNNRPKFLLWTHEKKMMKFYLIKRMIFQ